MSGKFTFNKRVYEYVDAVGNQTRVNERRMELPIAFEFVGRHKDVLEVGNVTRHYHREFTHPVIDLYEQSKWPIWNEDVLTFNPPKRYEAVVSISTVEHTIDALTAIKRITEFASTYLITTPFGYKTTENIIDLDLPTYFMKRVNDDNDWIQVEKEDARGSQYNHPFPFANCVAVITNEK